MEQPILHLDMGDGASPVLRSRILAGARVALSVGGQPARVVAIKPATDEYDCTVRACELSGAGHGLSDWADITGGALFAVIRTCEPLAERYFELRDQHQGDPAALLAAIAETRPQHDAARQVLTDALAALDERDGVCARASEIIAGECMALAALPAIN